MLVENYLIIKAFHVVAVISWVAGLLYLPRLFVYHVNAKKDGELDTTLRVMEHRLLRYIMNPAMIAVLLTGGLLIYIAEPFSKHSGMWMHLKSLLLILLFACHGLMAKYRKNFSKGLNVRSQKYFRIFNEIPTILVITIVFLAFIKP